MTIRYREWLFLLPLVGVGILLANWVGYGVAAVNALPGVLIMLGIAFVAVVCTRIIPLKLPVVAYCSLLGMLLASPISPVSAYVIHAVDQVNFAAPLTIVGAFAGISVGMEIKRFIKQGWQMVLISLLVMTATFVGSACVAQLALKLTGNI